LARRPVLGITAALESAGWAVWKETLVNISQRAYSLCVADAGAIPVVLPADEASEASPDDVLDIVDGLILSGGADLDPASYGAEPHETTTNFKRERDRFEIALCRRAIERDMPLLGICRGMQLLNVACGGTLVQNIADSDVHNPTPGRFASHTVRLEPGSLAARAMGEELVEVHSHHHQGIDRLGDDLAVTGWADPGDSIEAIEMPSRGFVLGLIWHPEENRSSPAIRALADAARQGVPA
jgi:putative glutamine amidotransferase